MSTKKWTITITATETEGRNTTIPWYSAPDIRDFVRTRLDYLNPPLDLKWGDIEAERED